ncbi:vacuolar protein sorting [Xylariaceae sp. FL1272]|nr:vacuolar protein sorting [Xylariaceae sp. FL1272]
MRPSGPPSSPWSSAVFLLLAALLWAAGVTDAKSEPTIVVTPFKSALGIPSYFPDSDAVLLQESGSSRAVWRSADGGVKWAKVEGIDHDAAVALVMHEHDPKRAYILTLGKQHWKTHDRGETWQPFLTDAYLSDFIETWGNWMVFHAQDPDKILFTGMECEGFFCEEFVMYTTDGFGSVNPLRRATQGCSWAKTSTSFTTGQPDLDASRILCIVKAGYFADQSENRLLMSDNYFQPADASGQLQEKEVNLNGFSHVQGVVRIVEAKRYLLAATTSRSTAEMALFVTDDAQVWHRAIFPQDHTLIENAYTVLESTNYSIQIDVRTNKRTSSPMGTLLTSNSNGTYFTRNMEHTNRDPSAIVDFEKVTGIQGIFLVNQVDNWEAVEADGAPKKIKTVITFDDGRTFESIKTGDDDIHLHSVTELNNVGPLFSSPAPGLVMGNGNSGGHLQDYWSSHLYVSDDAGKTWLKGPDGPHKYEFGDQGSVLLAIQHSKEANVREIKYSLDHGQNWVPIKLPDDLSIAPVVLMTTQDSTSLKFLLTAQNAGDDPAFSVISIDFEGLHEDTCKKGDMEDWFAHKGEDGKPSCIMGHTQQYLRRKKNAKCFIKHEFEEALPESSPCQCADLDFECDFNFARDGGECKPIGPVLAPEGACEGGNPDEIFKGTSGWRRIPGNDCSGGVKKDEQREWKCSDAKAPPSKGSGKIDVELTSFKGQFDWFEKHYLERGEVSSSDDETIIAWPKSSSHAGEIAITHDHGKKWAAVKELKGQEVREIVTHPYVKDMAFFITAKGKVYYTTDRGKSMDFFEPRDPAARTRPLAFHPNRPDWLIWHGQRCHETKPCYTEASISIDRGFTWNILKRYVGKCEFTGSNAYSFRSKEQIVCSARAHENDDPEGNPLQLFYTDEFPKEEFNMALDHAIDFATMNEFIVVATEDPDNGTLSALASIDGKKYADAHFPFGFKVPHRNAYTVLDSSTHAVNLFVATETEDSRQYGSILKSNSNGTSYVMSISGVNCNEEYYVDFEKMLGLEGVAVVNTVVNRDSDSEPKTLQSKISHNDGAQWSFIPPPAQDSEGKPYACSSKSGDEGCALHVHGYTERPDRRKTYSSESAVGVMFASGNVGPILGDGKEVDTFMTQDAGFTWREVKKGDWTWSFGDQGSIIVLAPRNTKTKAVSYSYDRGSTWEEKQISDSEVTITDITTLRSGSSRNFIVWGNKGDGVFTANLDFSGVRDKVCVHDENDAEKSDYELWSPQHPMSVNGCLFGHRNQYLRKKPDRVCYNDMKLQNAYRVENCECERADFECDFNFEMDSHGQCNLVDGLEPADPAKICRADAEATEYWEPSGFRRIPLTTCRGGLELDKTRQSHPCPGHEEEFEKKHGMSGIAIFFAVIIPFAFATLAGWWVYNNWQGKFGQIRLGEQSSLDNDAPWVKYPVIAISAVVALVGALAVVASGAWRTLSSNFAGFARRDDNGRYTWLRSRGPRRFTTRDSFARGRGDYAIADEDEGELLGDESDDEV